MSKLKELTKEIQKENLCEACKDGYSDECYNADGYCKRPNLTLEDVLIVTDNSLEVENVILKIKDKIGHIMLAGGMRSVDIKWKLGKPLHLQPKETIDFLHNLILNK